MTSDAGTAGLYNRQFWLLCLSSLLFFASFNMLIPELPAYLTSLGGASYKGLIISLFTLTAMISRPFSGKLADRVGRVPVILVGAVVCCICSLFYPLVSTVSGFMLLRFVHGFSTGFTPTGQSTYLSDIIPSHKRGEAMGFLGTAGSLGMASGPVLGGFIASKYGINVMFYCTSFLGLASAAIVGGIKETLKPRQPFTLAALAIKKKDLFEPLVLAPCLVMVLSAYAYGAVYTLIPDFGLFVGIANKGVLFAYLTLSSLVVRLVSGKASDHFGRAPVLTVSMIVIVLAMITIGSATSSFALIAGVTLYGFAHGATSPTLLAWATDLSDEHHKGRALASVYICMELGIGVGAFISGIVYGNDPRYFFIAFAISAALAGLSFLFLISRKYLSGVF